jgi:hypothetical protein
VVVLLALLLCSSGVGARAQVVDAEAAFVARIAQERAAHGMPAYETAADLRDVARRHAQRMADDGRHYHNPNLASEVGGWSLLAENVGYGPTVDGLHAAFMASSVHRSAILSAELTQVGIGVVRGADDQLYVVQVFRRPAGPAPSPPAAPPPTTAPAPPVTAAPAPPPPPAPPVTAAPPPPAAEVLAAPIVAAPAPASEPQPPPVAPATVGSATKARIATPPAPAIDVERVAREVPTAGWVGALLLAAVVALQGQTVRRLGLA